MNDLLLAPPLAFAAYLLLGGLLWQIGKWLGAPAIRSGLESGPYASGEAPPARGAPTGYRAYFRLALFFAILHLGARVLAVAGLQPLSGLFVVGLLLALLVLMLG